MKKIMLALALLPISAFAVTTYEPARVVSVTPQTEQVRNEGRCRDVSYQETEQAQPNSGVGGTIIGGVVGGLLGNQVGGGSGRKVATAAGVIGGALVGGNIDRNRDREPQQVTRTRQVCDQDSYSSVTSGYIVTYLYKGQRDTVVMQNRPGRTIQMRITAEPVAR